MPDQTPMVKDVMSGITVQGVITTSHSLGLLFHNVRYVSCHVCAEYFCLSVVDVFGMETEYMV